MVHPHRERGHQRERVLLQPQLRHLHLPERLLEQAGLRRGDDGRHHHQEQRVQGQPGRGHLRLQVHVRLLQPRVEDVHQPDHRGQRDDGQPGLLGVRVHEALQLPGRRRREDSVQGRHQRKQQHDQGQLRILLGLL